MKLSASSTNLLRPTRTMNKVSAFLKNLFPRNIEPSSADLPNKRSDFSAPHPHKGIKINKNFLLTLITSLLGVIVYSFFISFTPSEKTVTSQDEPAKKILSQSSLSISHQQRHNFHFQPKVLLIWQSRKCSKNWNRPCAVK